MSNKECAIRGIILESGIRIQNSAIEEEFQFLNKSKAFKNNSIDWKSTDMPRLWQYNLHYFDYLNDANCTIGNKTELVLDWIRNNPVGEGVGWESYTTSLRIVNWVKIFAHKDCIRYVIPAWLTSLRQQAMWLENNIEYHILANHYLKNGKALFFVGAYFNDKYAQRWLRIGLDILLSELDEQILPDGGHYERSPMYHCIVVEDYLDVLNIALNNDGLIATSDISRLKIRIKNSLDFLLDLCFQDGDISLFNDSTFRIAPGQKDLVNYANRLFGYNKKVEAAEFYLDQKKYTGYYSITNGDSKMIIDCGPGGPDYQPGHTHCDMLSYELMLKGRRVIVDSGVFEYEAGAMRDYVRSTKAHNTVMIDGEEQSEIWGEFRVARRAKPLYASLEETSIRKARFVGAHDGYRRLRGKVVHERIVEYDEKEGWLIQDYIQGTGKHKAESYIHIHPEFSAQQKNNVINILNNTGIVFANIIVDDNTDEVNLGKSWYCPEFGKKQENDMIVLSKNAVLPFSFSYRILEVE